MRAVSEYNYKRYEREIDPGFVLTPENLVKMVSWDQLTHTLNGADWRWTTMCEWGNCRQKYCTDLMPVSYDDIPHTKRLANAISALSDNVDVIHCLEHGDAELTEKMFGAGLLPDKFAMPWKNETPHFNATQISRSQLTFLQSSSLDYQLYLCPLLRRKCGSP